MMCLKRGARTMDMKDKISTRRKELGLTLEEIGDFVGVGKSTVRKWETGDIANMRRDKIALLADALQVTPAYLMGWEEPDTKKAPSNDEVTFDDFTYAMNEEAHELTDEEKDKLLELAKFFREQRHKE